MSLAKTMLVRNDEGAKDFIVRNGMIIPPIYEIISNNTGVTFRQMFVGWLIADKKTQNARGAVILFSSQDGEDCELMSAGGWSATGARELFRMVFDEMHQYRVSARCKIDNVRNVRILQKFGFVIEGVKRLKDGDVYLFGMRRDECKLLEAK